MIDKETKITAYTLDRKDYTVEPASPKREWMDKAGNGFPYKCLPMTIANQMGYIVRNPVGITAYWKGGDALEDLVVEKDDDDNAHWTVHSHFGYGVLTWQIPWLFRTSEDVAFLVTGPLNQFKPYIQACSGLVETFWSPYSFTMNWKFVVPHKPIRFEKGEPIAMLIPYDVGVLRNVVLERKLLCHEPELQQQYRRWAQYRSDFNEDKTRDHKEWQKDYFKGKKCPFSGEGKENKAPGHMTRVHLPRFNEI